jgi:hypothetical protein
MNLKSNFIKKSLKPIKKKLQNKNKLFLTIKRVYTHLSDLSNEEILDYYNVNSIKDLDAHIEHVKEILKKQIENYEEELQEIDACFCLDSRGDFKYLYETKKEAERQVQFTLQSKHVKLTLYSCPFHCGWHLSKL